MGIEYKIKFPVPDDYSPESLFRKFPSPIEPKRFLEVYNDAIESDGFYFVDHLVNHEIASMALRRLVDEALVVGQRVEIIAL